MDSSTALLQVSSGLEKLMKPNPVGVLKDSTVAQISAFLYYEANVMGNLTKNKQFQSLFKKTIFSQIEKDFGEYIDTNARVRPRSLHHVYEWNKTGIKEARLFKLNKLDTNGLSFQISYEFKLSKTSVPIKNKKQKKKYIFATKASIMEAGIPLVIHPKGSERLVFELDGIPIFMPKGASVTVRRPGGASSTHQFSLAYGRFFGGQLVNNSIKSSGFQNIFNSRVSKALKAPIEIKKVQYSFTPGKIRLEADTALTSSFGGSL